MEFLLQLVLFLVFLSILVIIHEIGHFVTARLFGVYCHEFSIGMGPVIYRKKIGETNYSLRAFPIGGYVSMAGETNAEAMNNVPYERTINGIKPWKKAIVMGAGVFLNFVLGYTILFGFVMAIGVQDNRAFLQVTEDSLMEQGGLKTGDQVIYIEGVLYDSEGVIRTEKEMVVNTFYDLLEVVDATDPIADGDSQCLTFTTTDGTFSPICREEVDVTIVEGSVTAISPLFGFTNQIVYQPVSIGDALVISFNSGNEMAGMILGSLGTLFTPKGFSEVSGPIGMYTIANDFLSLGFWQYLYFWSVISINLAVVNLLPIPGLDGSRLIVLGVESILRKKLDTRIENIINAVGLFALLGLMAIIALKDIVNLF